ncbi:hypothetical protein EB118_16675 [bacterium]|nr:hypothetical protein [bacterium]
MDIWVIGNGESRRNFAITRLKDHTIGCNAVHRDHLCTEYVAVDRRMVQEILNNSATLDTKIHTRPDWANEYVSKRVIPLPEPPFTGPNKVDKPFHWNSGPYAILLASFYYPSRIHLLGFDLYGINGLVNNLYKDTLNYSKSDTRLVCPDFWVYQLAKIFSFFHQIEFVQHQVEHWQMPQDWKQIKNLTLRTDIV